MRKMFSLWAPTIRLNLPQKMTSSASHCVHRVEYVNPSSSAGDWWTVFVAAVPCFNPQATLVVNETVKSECDKSNNEGENDFANFHRYTTAERKTLVRYHTLLK
jgi:hypothetical protein